MPHLQVHSRQLLYTLAAFHLEGPGLFASLPATRVCSADMQYCWKLMLLGQPIKDESQWISTLALPSLGGIILKVSQGGPQWDWALAAYSGNQLIDAHSISSPPSPALFSPLVFFFGIIFPINCLAQDCLRVWFQRSPEADKDILWLRHHVRPDKLSRI